MRQKQQYKRIPVLLLCLLLAVFWVAADYLSGAHAGHACQPEACPVCLLILASRQLRQWLLGLCLLASLGMAARACAMARVSAVAAASASPVSNKVKLSC